MRILLLLAPQLVQLCRQRMPIGYPCFENRSGKIFFGWLIQGEIWRTQVMVTAFACAMLSEGSPQRVALKPSISLRFRTAWHNIYNDLSTAISLMQQSADAQEQRGVGRTPATKLFRRLKAWWPQPV